MHFFYLPGIFMALPFSAYMVIVVYGVDSDHHVNRVSASYVRQVSTGQPSAIAGGSLLGGRRRRLGRHRRRSLAGGAVDVEAHGRHAGQQRPAGRRRRHQGGS